MRAIIVSAVMSLLVGGAARAATVDPVPRAVVSFQHLYGVDGPFLGEQGALRNIPGDDLPWTVEAVEGRVNDDGSVRIHVRGLVFADDPSVPADLVGTNDSPTFRAAVSCLQEKPDGGIGVVNHFTAEFAATPEGDSNISGRIGMPDACIAPIVFIVGGDEGLSFAISGVEMED